MSGKPWRSFNQVRVGDPTSRSPRQRVRRCPQTLLARVDEVINNDVRTQKYCSACSKPLRTEVRDNKRSYGGVTAASPMLCPYPHYLKCTPTRFAERQATMHCRLSSSGLMMSVTASGNAAGPGNSISAPVADRLRMTHSMTPPGIDTDPPLKVRCLVALRLSGMGNSMTAADFRCVKFEPT
jgi:hypothetical protein